MGVTTKIILLLNRKSRGLFHKLSTNVQVSLKPQTPVRMRLVLARFLLLRSMLFAMMYEVFFFLNALGVSVRSAESGQV